LASIEVNRRSQPFNVAPYFGSFAMVFLLLGRIGAPDPSPEVAAEIPRSDVPEGPAVPVQHPAM